MRKSTIYLLLMAVIGTALVLLLFVHPLLSFRYYEDSVREKKRLVQELRITDLCLFTEARYTRHPSQADLNSAFQDHPMALEHFPSGSILLPPISLWGFKHDMD
jgi:hypothetical protein